MIVITCYQSLFVILFVLTNVVITLAVAKRGCRDYDQRKEV